MFIWNKHFPGLLNHGLRLQLVICKAMPARIKRLLTRHAGQGEVSGVRIKVHHDVGRVSGRNYRRRWAGRAWRGVRWYGLRPC